MVLSLYPMPSVILSSEQQAYLSSCFPSSCTFISAPSRIYQECDQMQSSPAPSASSPPAKKMNTLSISPSLSSSYNEKSILSSAAWQASTIILAGSLSMPSGRLAPYSALVPGRVIISLTSNLKSTFPANWSSKYSLALPSAPFLEYPSWFRRSMKSCFPNVNPTSLNCASMTIPCFATGESPFVQGFNLKMFSGCASSLRLSEAAAEMNSYGIKRLSVNIAIGVFSPTLHPLLYR